MSPNTFRILLAAATLTATTSAGAATLYKSSSTGALNTLGDWWTTEAGTTTVGGIGTSDTLWFGGSGQGASMTSLTLGGDMTVGALRLDNITGTPNYNVTIAAGNTLTLNGNNNYNAGYLSGIVLNSGTGGTLTLNCNVALGSTQSWVTSRNLTVGGNVNLGANTLSLYTAGGTTTISGVISGTGGISRITSAGGTAVLSGANTYSGATTVNVGTLTISGANATTGLTLVNGGTLNITGANAATGATTMNSGTLSLDYSTQDNSKLADGAALTLNGGTLQMTGATGTHTEVVASTTIGGVAKITRSGANTAVIALGALTNNGLLDVAG